MVKGSKTKTRTAAIVIGIFMAAILALGAVAGAQFSSMQAKQNSDFGGLGSAHVHATFMVKLNGEIVDFSNPVYQVRSPYIHVENGDGFTLHRHARLVPVGEFLHSLEMDIRSSCFYLDDGTRYCDSGDKTLRFYVNGVQRGSIMDYVLIDGDRILIVYGDNSQDALNRDLEMLDQLTIKPA